MIIIIIIHVCHGRQAVRNAHALLILCYWGTVLHVYSAALHCAALHYIQAGSDGHPSMVLKTVTVHKHALPVQVWRGAARHGMADILV